jgi:transposase-like protein
MPAHTHRTVSVFDSPRWSEEDAREALGALERSGQSVAVFAAEHDLDPQRLYSWRRRLGVHAERTMFEELAVPGRGDAVADRFEVVLASGTVVRVPARFDAEALSRLLSVLAQSVAC